MAKVLVLKSNLLDQSIHGGAFKQRGFAEWDHYPCSKLIEVWALNINEVWEMFASSGARVSEYVELRHQNSRNSSPKHPFSSTNSLYA